MNVIKKLRSNLAAKFPEREHVIDGALAAVLAGEHVLLVGPPGTAKSALARAIAKAFGGGYYERLLTKFSTPEELFGPISLKGLEQDRFERVIEGKLPAVEFGFVDEIFKSSSAILNSLLTLMNERLFHNGSVPVECPLVTLFGASNELPEDKSLDALSDRFLVKYHVDYLTEVSSFRAIVTSPNPVAEQIMTMKELQQEQQAVVSVRVSEDTIDGLISIRDACADEGIIASDRRWKASLKLVQASAHILGQSETTPDHLQILSDVLWRDPKEREKIARTVAKYADPTFSRIEEIVRSAREAAARRANEELSQLVDYLTAMPATTQRMQLAVTDALVRINAMIVEASRPEPTRSLGVGVVGMQRNR